MHSNLFERLYTAGLISEDSLRKVKAAAAGKLFSLHAELRITLYLGVLLLSTGLGILVYKHIDTIGHQVVLLFIAAVSAGCFYYCYKKTPPFSFNRVAAPAALSDYLLLLACLTFVSFIAYLQYQYAVFGNHLRLAGFIPLVVLFFSAYYFDHLGVLSLAITNLAAWMGIVVTPLHILRDNDFNSSTLIYTGLALGVLLVAAGEITYYKYIKKHFRFTYVNIGAHVLFIATLAAMFHFERVYYGWFLLLAALAAFFYWYALRQRSFYFMLILTLYGYIGVSDVVLHLLMKMDNSGMGALYLGLIYFIGSAIGLILLLIHLNKKIKQHAGI
ncbi:MAG TPA: DUF2157 domain-containing protein [Chitinophaga sp.]|uniref:DUF2157 domain-containing protein n=1 Tax=Chitinophaga sp. TaxID=1869181 RepID=UPI002DBA68A4|nr:DUF2157 domain-containing protein [Chitinophaga sp.]HEU4555705.1 DUF2157 domain-containing protein [Chitinophaga sp.]